MCDQNAKIKTCPGTFKRWGPMCENCDRLSTLHATCGMVLSLKGFQNLGVDLPLFMPDTTAHNGVLVIFVLGSFHARLYLSVKITPLVLRWPSLSDVRKLQSIWRKIALFRAKSSVCVGCRNLMILGRHHDGSSPKFATTFYDVWP